MKIAYGCTRFVILTERYAIKIARPRPLHWMIRLIQHFQKKRVKTTLHRYDDGLIRAAIKYLAVGILANRTESRLYKKHGGDILVPTLFTLCWIVNVQVRGEPATTADVAQSALWNALQTEGVLYDVLHPKQWCVIDGGVYLADYGKDALDAILPTYALA